MSIALDELLKLEPEEIIEHDETPSMEDLRNPKQIYFEDVAVGTELPRYINHYSGVHFNRWCIAMENTHRVHYDYPHAMNHDKLPGVLFHGTWRMSIVAKWLKNWILPNGWAWKSSWQIRDMVVPGEVTVLWGTVKDKHEVEGYGLVELDFGIVNQDGVEGAPGSATVALPYRDGDPVPYPFVPPASY